jgi:phosphoglycerate dehydrogenase-like enzyme
LDAVRKLTVPCAATPLINYFAVAEHCWALILNHLKKMAGQREGMRTRAYLQRQWGTFRGLQLACDQTLGLLGFGEIARPMARIAKAFNMRVLYWDVVRFEALEAEYGVEYVSWEHIFSEPDIVSVHLALNDKTHGIIGQQEIDRMKQGALFLNTARGKLVDQAALTQAIREKRIAAALDVFAEEPLPANDPLHALHEDLSYDLTLTAHTAWQSPWTHVRDSLVIWNNVLRDLRGEDALYLVR